MGFQRQLCSPLVLMTVAAMGLCLSPSLPQVPSPPFCPCLGKQDLLDRELKADSRCLGAWAWGPQVLTLESPQGNEGWAEPCLCSPGANHPLSHGGHWTTPATPATPGSCIFLITNKAELFS